MCLSVCLCVLCILYSVRGVKDLCYAEHAEPTATALARTHYHAARVEGSLYFTGFRLIKSKFSFCIIPWGFVYYLYDWSSKFMICRNTTSFPMVIVRSGPLQFTSVMLVFWRRWSALTSLPLRIDCHVIVLYCYGSVGFFFFFFFFLVCVCVCVCVFCGFIYLFYFCWVFLLFFCGFFFTHTPTP